MNHAEIEQLERARRAAMLSCDVAALDTLTSAEMTWVHGSAKVDDKQSFLEGFRTGRLRCFRRNIVRRAFASTARRLS
jgi:hypothetical protein